MVTKKKTRAKARVSAKTFAGYLAALEPEQRAALERLRQLVLSVAPGAEECISYQLPAFRLGGKVLVWFGAMPKHLSFFPGAVVQAFQKELSAFSTSKGTIRFQPDQPLPAALVKKLVKARIAKIGVAPTRSAAPAGKKR